MNYKKLFILLTFCMLLAGCREEAEQPARMDLSLCLPASEVVHPNRGPRRVMGDPGTQELFEFPKYAYIFVMKKGAGDTWSVWRKEERVLEPDKWEATRYGGRWDTRGDSIYRYKQEMYFMLNKERPQGRVYAVCSKRKLTFDTDLSNINNLEDLLKLKFETAPDTIQKDLQSIYSTPYNYEPAGQYYCSFDCSSGTSFTVDLLLYHVAAKVDIKWNVEDSVRIDRVTPANGVRLTYMDAIHLYTGDAYCFKPMENVVEGSPLSTGDTVHIVGPNDEGLWWEGRSYFYTIPYTTTATPGYYPLQMKMQTNGTGSAGYTPTLYLKIKTAEPFVPWLRADFNLSKQLTAGSDTKTVE